MNQQNVFFSNILKGTKSSSWIKESPYFTNYASGWCLSPNKSQDFECQFSKHLFGLVSEYGKLSKYQF